MTDCEGFMGYEIESFFWRHMGDYQAGFLELLDSMREKTLLDPEKFKEDHKWYVVYWTDYISSSSSNFHLVKVYMLEEGIVYEYKLLLKAIVNFFLENIPLSILKEKHPTFYICLLICSTPGNVLVDPAASELSTEVANFLIRNKIGR